MITFEVGNSEKHSINFDYDIMWGGLTISVDGKELTKTRKMVVGETPFQFQIGNEEKHDVRILLNNPLGFAFRGSSMKAFVDGKLIHEEHIGASRLFIIILAVLLALTVYMSSR